MKRVTIYFFLLSIFISCFFLSCSKKSEPKPPANPTATSLSVNSGTFNTSVIITGTGFSTTLSEDQVFFNGKAAVITAATATQLTATVPLAAGTGNVTISIKNGAIITGPVFTYELSAIVSTIAGDMKFGLVNGTGTAARFSAPFGLTLNSAGFIYVADYGNNLIRQISSAAEVTTFAGHANSLGEDGKGVLASFNYPTDMKTDASGNIYVADGSWIRKITPDATVTTLTGYPPVLNANLTGIAIDASGNIFAGDVNNNLIYKRTTAGVWSIFAGSGTKSSVDGKGTAASFYYPYGLTIDAAGNLFVVDEGSGKIRKITPDGDVTTLAGSGSAGSANGTGAAASFKLPLGIIVDPQGNVYVSDSSNNMIRKITPGGVVSTLAGSTTAGSVDGPGATATFNSPQGLALDAAGNIYVADTNNSLIRKISFQ